MNNQQKAAQSIQEETGIKCVWYQQDRRYLVDNGKNGPVVRRAANAAEARAFARKVAA